MKKEAKMWKRKNADQRVKRTFKTADEVLKVGAGWLQVVSAVRWHVCEGGCKWYQLRGVCV